MPVGGSYTDNFIRSSANPRGLHGQGAVSCLNVHGIRLYRAHMALRSLLIICLSVAASVVVAQQDTAAAPWLDREFRYWQGDPMTHGPNGECIAGYTDEERFASFFRDGRYQEIVFEDRGFAIVRMWWPGDCDPLQGDTVAVITGTWTWASDTLRVTVERTAQYPLEDVLEQYLKRDMDKPFSMPMPPSRICNTERERRFWFEGDRLEEDVRTWK